MKQQWDDYALTVTLPVNIYFTFVTFISRSHTCPMDAPLGNDPCLANVLLPAASPPPPMSLKVDARRLQDARWGRLVQQGIHPHPGPVAEDEPAPPWTRPKGTWKPVPTLCDMPLVLIAWNVVTLWSVARCSYKATKRAAAASARGGTTRG